MKKISARVARARVHAPRLIARHSRRVAEASSQLALGLPKSDPPPPLYVADPDVHPSKLLGRAKSAYRTDFGAMYQGDALKLLAALPDHSVDLVLTSPPYALEFKKEYGNASKSEYVDWFIPFAKEISRVLRPSGSFVLNIGGTWDAGQPTRSLYHFRLLLRLCDELGFYLAQEAFWFNPAKLPSPAEWVNVRRIRVKDSVEYVWWLSPTAWPDADNRRVLTEYSPDMQRLLRKGYRAKERPSGHRITAKFKDRGGAIPPNLIERGNNESNSDYIRRCEEAGLKPHPARFPSALPEFFIKLVTQENALVLDPFGGSNTTGSIAERFGRRWLAFELEEKYIQTSRFRFPGSTGK
jgi:DNA modification methylase